MTRLHQPLYKLSILLVLIILQINLKPYTTLIILHIEHQCLNVQPSAADIEWVLPTFGCQTAQYFYLNFVAQLWGLGKMEDIVCDGESRNEQNNDKKKYFDVVRFRCIMPVEE